MKKLIFVFVLFFFATSSALAAGYSLKQAVDEVTQSKGGEYSKPNYLPTPKNDEETPDLILANTIQRVTNYITALSAGVAILFIVINAGKLVFALGNSENITTAKKGLTWSVAGLGIVMFAFVLAKTVISLAFTGNPSG